jgi:hypothetical protein
MGAITRGHANLITTAGKLLSSGVDGGVGKIGQVVQGTKTTQFETTSTSYATSGLEATITPSATSSKILIMASTSAIHTATTSAGGETLVKFYKNHTSISATAIGDDYQVAKSRQDGSYNQEVGGGGTAMFLDTPSTTEAITYTVYAKINSGTNGRIGQNNHGTTITLMEILA